MRPGDENKVIRFEQKIAGWKRDVVDKKRELPGEKTPKKQQMREDMYTLKNERCGYWWEGETCKCDRSHWVVHDIMLNCWECMHAPCACEAPLVWDEKENAYYYFFCRVTDWQSATFGFLSQRRTSQGWLSRSRKRKGKRESRRKERRRTVPKIKKMPTTKDTVATSMVKKQRRNSRRRRKGRRLESMDRTTVSTVTKTHVSSFRLRSVCAKMMISISMRRTTEMILWGLTLVDVSVPTSTQPSSCGKESTTESHTTSVCKTAFVRWAGIQWDTKKNRIPKRKSCSVRRWNLFPAKI